MIDRYHQIIALHAFLIRNNKKDIRWKQFQNYKSKLQIFHQFCTHQSPAKFGSIQVLNFK